MATKKEPAIPLREMLKAVDTNDFNFYSRLSTEQKKSFSAWMAMRYASAAQGNAAYHYLLMVNDIVNRDFSALKGHPELQWKLLCVCGIGQPTFHPWIAPGKKRKRSKVQAFLGERFPQLSNSEIDTLEQLNSKNDIRKLAEDFGMQDKDIDELFK
jgi:hypothetical protein